MKRIIKKITLIYRRLRYSFNFKKMGKNIKIYGKLFFDGNKDIIIGDNCTLNHGVFLNGNKEVIIGDHCRLSPYVQIYTGGLDLNQHYIKRNHYKKRVELKKGVLLCANVIVLSGVTIGEGSVVASNSVVKCDIPPFELWGGTPAKKIKDLIKKPIKSEVPGLTPREKAVEYWENTYYEYIKTEKDKEIINKMLDIALESK